EVGAGLGIARDHAVTFGRGRSREAIGAAGAKISKLRAARLVSPAAPMEAFTAEERASLVE
ncbi:MAG TPA: VWA domain-containing protein, partial [Nocardioides sp.]|nr:VWA domain-containing protein [Nocardioides sp.]